MGPWFHLFLKWEYSWKDPVRGVSEEICSTGPTRGGGAGEGAVLSRWFSWPALLTPVLQAPGPVSAIQLHSAGHAQTSSADLQGAVSLQTHCVSLVSQASSPFVNGQGSMGDPSQETQVPFVFSLFPPSSLWFFIFKCFDFCIFFSL